MGAFTVADIEGVFGSWTVAMEAAGIERVDAATRNRERMLADDELLADIRRVAAEVGRPPTEREQQRLGRFSIKPFAARWGRFADARALALQGEANHHLSQGREAPPAQGAVPPQGVPAEAAAVLHAGSSGRRSTRTLYGEPIRFRGLLHAPVNEQGVVYLFGMVSRELGFLVEAVKTAYPDCEAKRRVAGREDTWEGVLIEFEFRSSNFVVHGHAPAGADIIVCWEHDWPACPLEVVELRRLIGRLPQ